MKKGILSLFICALLALSLLCGCNAAPQSSVSVEPQSSVASKAPSELPKDIDGQQYYTIIVTVNPEIELYVSPTTGKVLRVDTLNEDAEKLLAEMKLELSEKEYDEAVEAYLKACADADYLSESNNDISIVAGKEHDETVDIPDEYGEEMSSVAGEVSDYVDFDVVMYIPCPCCEQTGNCTLCHGDKTLGCEVCGGVGTWTCTECSGSGKHSCPDCEGSGGCPKCGNTGKQTCDKCGGSGCEWCGGSGTMECTSCHGHSVNERCQSCEGTGIINCGFCIGTGSCKCNGCDGKGYITCVRCNGDGLCPSCRGTKQLGPNGPPQQ